MQTAGASAIVLMRKALACFASKGALLPLALFPRQSKGLPHSGLPLRPRAPINIKGKSKEKEWAPAVWGYLNNYNTLNVSRF